MMYKTPVEIKTISECFRGRCIFITGASGFIGKVLIEKFLRSCPDIENIYILIREKKGKSSQQRIQEIVNLPLFDKIREQNEGALKKIIPIFGDITQPDLGISAEDRKILISNVSVVYHCAASVRFNDHLKDAIITNVRSTRDLINLIKQFKQLHVYVHVSTTFCNVDKQVIEEKIYPALSDWRDAINIAENVQNNDNTLEVMTLKYIHPFPNTYTYTKSLAEHVVEDLCNGNIPTVIYRPSIVTASFSDPFPGWTDNFNGPFGVVTAILKGFTTHFHGDGEIFMNLVFVDNVAKSLITAAWDKVEVKKTKHEITVYNACGDIEWKINYFYKIASRLTWEVPSINRIWYVGDESKINNCWTYTWIRYIIVTLIPTLFLEGLLILLRKQFSLLKLQRKIHIVVNEGTYFATNSWDFRNDKYEELNENLLESDNCAFNFYNVNRKTFEEIYDYSKNAVIGISKFLLHEPPATKETFRNTKRLYILDKGVTLILYGLVLYWIFWKCDIISITVRYVLALE